MKRKRYLLVCFMMFICQSWEIREAFSREPGLSVVIPRVKTPPKIDGKLYDTAWKQASRIKLAWTVRDEKVYESVQSQAMAVYDNAYLYVAFLNIEPDGRMLDGDDLEHGQALVSQDDQVEFVIDPGNMGKGSHFRISVSAGSMTFTFWKPPDALSTKIRSGEILSELIPVALAFPQDREWKPQSLQTATHVEGQTWMVELKIVFEDLLQSGAPVGQTWGGNFIRYDVGPGSLPMTWSKTDGNLYNPENLGELIFLR